MQIRSVGIDLGKTTFHLVALGDGVLSFIRIWEPTPTGTLGTFQLLSPYVLPSGEISFAAEALCETMIYYVKSVCLQ